MNLRCHLRHLTLSSSSVPFQLPVIPCHARHQLRHRRRWECRCQFGLENLFHAINSVPPFDMLVPVIGFASAAAAAYLSRSLRPPDDSVPAGDWILFTSPTPFNRCVLLRCPSVSFEDGGELLNSVNARLSREERHYVNLSRGRIPLKVEGGDVLVDELKYQRIYVRTDDGGVISLDWPYNLDMEMEQGLDTTVLIVPGTPEGSMNGKIRLFVVDVLKHGGFPIVFNPRGCAGSALTSARLFTAADSDDVCTAIKFISRKRPWTTLMAVGFGYGANMLTKYLAETGETAPVTAAVCIDSPFDLEDSTTSSPHHVALNQKLIGGLREILRANKELFQGKAKCFDVAKALSATTVHDFDKAVSMISYGFDALEDFYRQASARPLIHKLKIPILFIQCDDGTVPLFSIPRGSIADNPFTSLLLCSYPPSAISRGGRFSLLWSQKITIEWLSAVEHSLLKGRHPLLCDVDVTIKLSEGPAFMNCGMLEKSVSKRTNDHDRYDSSDFLLKQHRNIDSFMKLTSSEDVNAFFIDPHNNVNGNVSKLYDKVIGQRISGSECDGNQRDEEVETKENKSEKSSTAEGEGSQIVQTAAVVMNMLDATMPGTLGDEQKRKVLSAMKQGQTFMTALQGAVPEDVRGRITSAVTEIMHSQGNNLNVEGLKRIGWVPTMSSDLKSTVDEKTKGSSTKDVGYNDAPLESNDVPVEQSNIDNCSGDTAKESIDASREKASQPLDSINAGLKMEDKDLSNTSDQVGGMLNEDHADKFRISEKFGPFDIDMQTHDSKVIEEYVWSANDGETDKVVSSSQQDMSSTISEEASSSTMDVVPDDGNENQKMEQQTIQDAANENTQVSNISSKPNPISVTQALDALTGFDDSTQIAVNSVFGVIENMIDQLEKSNQEKMDQSKKFENQLSAKEVVESPPVDGKMSDNLPDESQRSVVSPQVYQPAAQGEDPVYEVRTESYEGIKDSLCQNKVKNTLAPSSDLDIDKVEDNLKIHESSKNLQKYDDISDLSLDVAMKRYCLSPYAAYLHGRFTTPLHKRLLKLESATDLFLDQEEGQWKMLDRSKSSRNVTFDKGKQKYFNLVSVNDLEDVIEPSYVILNGKYSMFCSLIQDNYLTRNKKEDAVKLDHFILVKNCLLDNLKVEVERRIGMPDSREFVRLLTYDLENFTDRVSRAVLHRCDLNSYEDNFASNSAKLGVIEGQTVAEIISLSLQDAGCVKKVLPLGVIVGSSLASLKNYFQVVAFRDDASRKTLDSPTNKQKISNSENGMKDDHFVSEKNEKHDEVLLPDINEPINKGHELGTVGSADGGIVVGAVTAALGASALLASNQKKLNNPYEDVKMPSAFSDKSLLCEDEITQEKSQNRLVSSLAEKAMSIAGPVVPTKDDGEVDHERLVTMLAGLGQKVGVLRLVGKVALLWGGMRGAISLTDRLISFLHIAERPLFQRLCGFVCMVLVLWSPVVIPLLPMLVQSCKTHTSNRIAEFVCLVGLYVAAMILVILWGKRIRNYDNPLQQYGLDLISVPRVLDFLKGLIGGITIVLCIHSVNALLGYSNISCSLELPSSLSGAIVLLKAYGNILILTIGEIVAATGISTVEELLFRSWLAEEAAADLGYPHSLVISGLLFALVQRSVSSVPFFMLLSLSLFGIKQRCGGQLAAPVGVRTGLMAANSIILHGNFLHYRSDTPFWLANAHPLHPFDGAVGIFLCAILAIVFYPKMPPCSSKVSRPIRD